MDKADAAESILRRVVSADRAAELVGDLLEIHPFSGRLRFWFAIAWLFLVFTWRTTVGIIAAVFIGIYLTFAEFVFVMSRRASGTRFSVDVLLAYLLGMSVLLWSQAAFVTVRFGFRSSLFKISSTAALICTLAVCSVWMPHAQTAFVVVTILFVLFQLARESRRRAFVVWFAVLAIGWYAARLFFVLNRVAHYPISKWPLLLAVVLVPIIEMAALLVLHKSIIDGIGDGDTYAKKHKP